MLLFPCQSNRRSCCRKGCNQLILLNCTKGFGRCSWWILYHSKITVKEKDAVSLVADKCGSDKADGFHAKNRTGKESPACFIFKLYSKTYL